MTQLFRNKAFLTFVLVLLAIVLLLGATRRERAAITIVESAFSDLLSPLQSFAAGVVRGGRTAVGSLQELARLREENAQLRARLESRLDLETRLAELQAENDLLRQQLGLVRESPLRYLSARVIGRSPDNWFETMTVDRGRADGVARNMAVVTERGLVGRVSRVTARTATVTLLTDRGSGVGAMVSRTRYPGVVLGQRETMLRMRLFDRDAQVDIGDEIVTSGLGGTFPQGIRIGTVRAIDRREYGLLKVATVAPHVDFQRLERVLIVLSSIPAPDAAPAAPEGGGR